MEVFVEEGGLACLFLAQLKKYGSRRPATPAHRTSFHLPCLVEAMQVAVNVHGGPGEHQQARGHLQS